LAEETRWPSADAAAWVKRFVEHVCHAPTTVALVLIGSLARATHDPSDVDLLYVYEREPVGFSGHPMDVDIRAYENDDFRSRLARRHEVVTWALRFGRVICQRDVFWSELISSFTGELPLPSPEMSERRAERAAEIYDQLIEIGDQDAALEQRITLLTHRAWARLLRKRIHPASRPELTEQLRVAGEASLAGDLAAALRERTVAKSAAESARRRRAG